MASLNKVILIGNLGADPDVRYTAGGTAVANLRIATTERWKDRDGKDQEKTEWHRVVVWGKQAESCKEYLRKGRQVYVEGSLETRVWEDKDKIQRYTTEVKAFHVLFLGSKEGGSGSPAVSGGGGRGSQPAGRRGAPPPVAPPAAPPQEEGFGDPGPAPISDEDIPF